MRPTFRTQTEEWLISRLQTLGIQTWTQATYVLAIPPSTWCDWRRQPRWSRRTAQRLSGLLGDSVPVELVKPIL